MAGVAPSAGDCAAYWKLEDLTDSSGNGYTMTNAGSTGGSTGILDDCYIFDGSNDKLSAGDVTSVEGIDEISISFWFKTPTFNINVYYGLINKGSYYTSGSSFGILMHNNRIQFSIANSFWTFTTFEPTVDTWYHIVLIYSKTDSYVQFFVNGSSLQNTNAYGTYVTIPNTASPLLVGSDSNNHFLYGSLDEIAIFDTRLTTDNIDYLYNSGSPGVPQQYPFISDSVTLLLPNGGESLTEADVYEITWSSTGTVGDLKIELSVNDGVDYSTIVASTSNDGSYDWIVPAEDSVVCLVKITDTGVPSVTDSSDAVFSISLIPPPPDKIIGGGHFVQSWLSPVLNFFDRGVGFVEQSNKMILDYVSSSHLQVAGDFSAVVVWVHDGDTVTLRSDFRDFTFPLRLANVDALELSEGGESAKEWLESRVLGKTVLVHVNTDNRVGKYGRLIGELFVNGLNVNNEMLRRGIVPAFGLKNEGHLESFGKILVRAGY